MTTTNPLLVIGQEYKDVSNKVTETELLISDLRAQADKAEADLASLVLLRDSLKNQLLQVAETY